MIEKKIAINLSGLHPKKYHQLITQFGCDGEIIGQPEAFYTVLNLPQHVQKRLQHPCIEAITKTQRWAELNHVHIIDTHHQHYPQHLKQLPCWPPLLYVQGNIQKLTQGNIAVVGSRNASFYGLEATKTFAQYLAKSGWIITSGLAIGVDKTAHQAALSVSSQLL